MGGSIPVIVTATGNLATALRRIHGWSFRETAGFTATIVLRQGGSGGTIIAQIPLAANEGVSESGLNIMVSDGTPHATVTGTVSGNFYGVI